MARRDLPSLIPLPGRLPGLAALLVVALAVAGLRADAWAGHGAPILAPVVHDAAPLAAPGPDLRVHTPARPGDDPAPSATSGAAAIPPASPVAREISPTVAAVRATPRRSADPRAPPFRLSRS